MVCIDKVFPCKGYAVQDLLEVVKVVMVSVAVIQLGGGEEFVYSLWW